MQEIRDRARLRDHQFFNALIGCHPILYPVLGLAAVFLMSPLAASSSGMNCNVTLVTAIRCLGGPSIISDGSLLLIGLVDWAWDQAQPFFQQQ